MWEVKKIQDFCPRESESCHLAARGRVKLWSLNTNLFFKAGVNMKAVFWLGITFLTQISR